MEMFRMMSTDGMTELACYRVMPEGENAEKPKALFQIVHGMCEYFGRYEPFAKSLAEQGALVFGHDHLGHGNSAPSPDDLGFTAAGGGADFLVEDVYKLTCKLKTQYPDTPVILFGHSMGSFVVREVLARHGDAYTAAIICGTGGTDSPAGAGKAMAKTIMAFRGERYRSKFLKNVAFAGYNKKFEKGCPANAWLSRDEELVRKYDNDPFCAYTFTVRAYHDLFTLVQWVSSKKWAVKLPKELPCLVTAGEMDPVGSWGKGPRTVAARMKDAGMTNVTLKLYPDMRHEILNELGHETVWKELTEWTFAQLPN
ncbi:MAG: lysophospholipase [Clostridia bacterium]|nr:lysophospholipase [Clostridia bacterium]